MMVAARLQAEENRIRRPVVQEGTRQETRKTVRVLVPRHAKAGDSLSVATPTAGKFAVKVPAWARPETHFDCIVTTIVEVRPPGRAAARQQATRRRRPHKRRRARCRRAGRRAATPTARRTTWTTTRSGRSGTGRRAPRRTRSTRRRRGATPRPRA